jgi:hypothetical protein
MSAQKRPVNAGSATPLASMPSTPMANKIVVNQRFNGSSQVLNGVVIYLCNFLVFKRK